MIQIMASNSKPVSFPTILSSSASRPSSVEISFAVPNIVSLWLDQLLAKNASPCDDNEERIGECQIHDFSLTVVLVFLVKQLCGGSDGEERHLTLQKAMVFGISGDLELTLPHFEGFPV